MKRLTRTDVTLPGWLLEKIQVLLEKELGGCSIPAYARMLIYADLKKRGLSTDTPPEIKKQEEAEKAEKEKREKEEEELRRRGAGIITPDVMRRFKM